MYGVCWLVLHAPRFVEPQSRQHVRISMCISMRVDMCADTLRGACVCVHMRACMRTHTGMPEADEGTIAEMEEDVDFVPGMCSHVFVYRHV